MLDEDIVDVLRNLKSSLFKAAQDSGTIGNIATICREQGVKLEARYGPKYKLMLGDIEIYVDDYGSYAVVHDLATKTVLMSTHVTERLFCPGAWVDVVLSRLPEAEAQIAKRKADGLRKLRNEIAAELGMYTKD